MMMITGSRLRWSLPTQCATLQSGNRVLTSLGNNGLFSIEPFSHGTGILRCLQKEMATWHLCPCGETQTLSHIAV